MTREEFNFIEDYYFNKHLKGIITPAAIDKCYFYITGTDRTLRGMVQKKLTLVRWMMTQYHTLKPQMDAKEATGEVILTKVGDDTQTNFSGRKIEINDDLAKDTTETALPKNGESETLSLTNEGQSHSEDYSDIYLGEDELEDEKTIWKIGGKDIEMVIEKECCSEEVPKELFSNKPKRKNNTNGRKRNSKNNTRKVRGTDNVGEQE